MISNPPPSSQLVVAEVEVFNGTSPLTWTDLDLVAVVGPKKTKVLLKTLIGGGGRTVSFRTNGDVDEFYNDTIPNYSGYGMAAFTSITGIHAVTEVTTDSTGKVEWKAEADLATTIDIICYLN